MAGDAEVLGAGAGYHVRPHRAVLLARDAALGAVEADLAVWFDKAPFAEGVRRLVAYRGVTRMNALALQAEVCDWRRFARGCR
ncbi:MAG TPA: hypothetical protein VK988_04335 [Acidimicrobiales bacterium]|nr:hypothetical protein [Acidimicrobiales bacterium]